MDSRIPTIETPRLRLRGHRQDDLAAYSALWADPIVVLHTVGVPQTPEECWGRFLRAHGHWAVVGFGYWVVRESEETLGFCGVKFMRLPDRPVLNLFYRFAPQAWGRGFASEAATAVVRWVSTNAPDHPIIARVRPDNVASQRVAVNAGLARAPHLDTEGDDGLDWIYAATSSVVGHGLDQLAERVEGLDRP